MRANRAEPDSLGAAGDGVAEGLAPEEGGHRNVGTFSRHFGHPRQSPPCLCFGWLSSAVSIINFFVIIAETNHQVNSSGPLPAALQVMDLACLAVYTVELGLSAHWQGWRVSRDPWAAVDAVVVSVGLGKLLVQSAGPSFQVPSTLRLMRLVRIIRLLRSMKQVRPLGELRKLIEMGACCLKTLVWSGLLCFVIMTTWSILSVELLHDVALEMQEEGVWADCDFCGHAFDSVMVHNVFLFQTVIVGDDWGTIALPIVQRHAWAMLIFAGTFISIVFGVLNLVVAVVVDTFADRRSKDTTTKALEMEKQEARDKNELLDIFEQIDQRGEGLVSYQELELGARMVPGFRQLLRVMDIDQHDLQHLFFLIDADQSGQITAEEFVDAMYRVKTADPRTATKILKHYVMNMLPQILERQAAFEPLMKSMAEHQMVIEKSLRQAFGCSYFAEPEMAGALEGRALCATGSERRSYGWTPCTPRLNQRRFETNKLPKPQQRFTSVMSNAAALAHEVRDSISIDGSRFSNFVLRSSETRVLGGASCDSRDSTSSTGSDASTDDPLAPKPSAIGLVQQAPSDASRPQHGNTGAPACRIQPQPLLDVPGGNRRLIDLAGVAAMIQKQHRNRRELDARGGRTDGDAVNV